MKKWSPLQKDIFDFVEHGAGNAIIKAVAGSGKTSTIVEAMKRIRKNAIFLAFNKSIAEELKSRGVNARTFHSLTFQAVTSHAGTRTIDADKLRRLCTSNLTGRNLELYGAFICKLVSLGKQVGIGCLVPDVTQSWLDICIHHDLEPEHDDADLGKGLELASSLMSWSNASKIIDFDDLLYVAVKAGLSLQKYSFVFVDEAQDTNAIQRALLRKITDKNSRLIAVGDPAQAIYGFRGADSESMNLIASEFDCVTLPLSISYRCPTSVVKYAQQWVPEITASETALEGIVENLEWDWTFKTFLPEDLVVCRTTAPLIKLAFKMIREKVPVYVMGREIGRNLKELINKMKVSTIPALEVMLDSYYNRELEKARVKNNESKVETLEDQSETMQCLMDSLDENEQTVNHLLHVIDCLFADRSDAVILATIHKSKGLESERVFWLNRSKCPSKWAKREWQMQQEDNLCYVATTRAKEELYFIEMV